jgi:hypothetical protein
MKSNWFLSSLCSFGTSLIQTQRLSLRVWKTKELRLQAQRREGRRLIWSSDSSWDSEDSSEESIDNRQLLSRRSIGPCDPNRSRDRWQGPPHRLNLFHLRGEPFDSQRSSFFRRSADRWKESISIDERISQFFEGNLNEEWQWDSHRYQSNDRDRFPCESRFNVRSLRHSSQEWKDSRIAERFEWNEWGLMSAYRSSLIQMRGEMTGNIDSWLNLIRFNVESHFPSHIESSNECFPIGPQAIIIHGMLRSVVQTMMIARTLKMTIRLFRWSFRSTFGSTFRFNL